MGLTAIVSSATSSLSLVSSGVGGAFVVVALVALLAYLDVFEVETERDRRVQSLLYATTVPLGIAFLGIVLFQSLQVL